MLCPDDNINYPLYFNHGNNELNGALVGFQVYIQDNLQVRGDGSLISSTSSPVRPGLHWGKS
jgi:hypothetical protein